MALLSAKLLGKGTLKVYETRAEPARSSAGNGCAREPRPALREHDPHARHERRSAGEFRASWNADGDGAGGLHAVAASAEIRSGRPGLAEPGRFVLSMGHTSMLLYSLLHPAGVKAADPDYERLGELSVTLDDIKHFRQLDSKCPEPLDLGHRDHHGAPGPGCGHQRGHG